METITRYQQVVKQALREYAAFLLLPPPPPYHVVTIFDDEHHQYLVCKLGWTKHRRIRQTVLHVAVREGKIWIEEDWTEEGLVSWLLEHGIPQEDIVLAFHPPSIRVEPVAAQLM